MKKYKETRVIKLSAPFKMETDLSMYQVTVNSISAQCYVDLDWAALSAVVKLMYFRARI